MTNQLNEQAEWQPPQAFSVDTAAELDDLSAGLGATRRLDPVEAIASDLFELRHPDQMQDADARTRFVGEILAQGPRFGRWIHYPWADALVRVAGPDDHYELRTYRNRNLITKAEQASLRHRRIAVFGLSVGSNVVDRMAQAGIGDEYLLFDFDRLSPTNLNRIQAGALQVGLLKTTVAGRKLAELDPYVTQRHVTGGDQRSADEMLRASRPDVIVEEVDDLVAKARIRALARELHVPLVTAGDVGDVSTLDIERHDIEQVPAFNGKLTDADAALLCAGTMPGDNPLETLISIVGRENVSQALLESVMLKGTELAGTPQLGSTAATGGALAAVAVRDILLGRSVGSGTTTLDIVASTRPRATTT
ncbi:ThiF family adenylyltransferase [Mycolicibacterium llatzerense]|uniref:ThiF family adenylyltransferase n=1 Tax=Mycolicibacterium llatzerense TaxID=280871 RepID=UPI0008DCF822|nr:ThiF family adenylyltransferase [Mycolicibacterium llatzerense]